MAKTTDFPHKLRHFVKVLNSFRGYYHDYDIFRDFIDYTTSCLLWKGDKEVADRLKSHYKEDYIRFNELFAALVQTMSDNLADELDWFDALGTLYEEISSRSKASFLGQFFTPPEICDMIARMQVPTEKVTNKTVNDPACGSGRLLLAFNMIAPGNYLVAQDLDPICTKMAAINFALHGCKGQVINGDSLNPADFKFGYEINPMINMVGGMPHIFQISKEKSVAWQIWENRRKEVEAEALPKPAIVPLPERKEIRPAAGMQLSIF